MSNAPVVSTITDNLLLLNEQFYEICSQLNEVQQHLSSFLMQYALHWKLLKLSNELPAKPFQMFLSECAGNAKSFLIKAITEYLKQVLRYPTRTLINHLFLWLHLLEKLLQVSMELDCILHFIFLLSQDWNLTSIKSQVVKLLTCWETNTST